MIILSYAVTLSLPDASYTRLSKRPPSYVVHFPSLVAPCHSLPTPSGVSRGRALSVHPPHMTEERSEAFLSSLGTQSRKWAEGGTTRDRK